MFRSLITRTAVAGLLLAASVAPTAVAQSQDLRNPDTRYPSTGARLDGKALPSQDLRSPDASDAAAGRGTFSAPDVTVVRLPQAAPPDREAGGIDWGDAGIGAASVFAAIALGLGGAFAIAHRRRLGGSSGATAS